MLQKSHSISKCQRVWRNEWGGKFFFHHGSSNSRGVAILFQPRTDYKVCDVFRSGTGKIVNLKIEINQMKIVISNIYAPNQDCPQFFNTAFDSIQGVECENIILGGDFNLALDMEKDKKGISYNNTQALDSSSQNMQNFTMVDVRRIKNPEKFCFTWKRCTPRAFARLDYFLMPVGMLGYLNEIEILRALEAIIQF